MSSCGKLKNETGLLNVQERAREEEICRVFFSGGSSWEEGARSDTEQTEQAVEGGELHLSRVWQVQSSVSPAFQCPPPHTLSR